MPLTNAATRYGTVSKTFHWLIALLILTNVALALVADQLPVDTMLRSKAQFFTIHKTIGVSILGVAVLRILWAISQPKPSPLHPERLAENFLADLAHWMLYASLLLVPVSGWVYHAATEGFAPIWWPLPQNLPGLVYNSVVAEVARTAHWFSNWMLFVALGLHVVGALKHHVVDRDATLRRMWFGGTEAGAPIPRQIGAALPVAVAIYTLVAIGTLVLSAEALPRREPQARASGTGAGGWAVRSGEIGFEVVQFGSLIEGRWAQWNADIYFDPESGTGEVVAQIDISSLSLGSVTDQAMGPAYFAEEDHPTATFKGVIVPDGENYIASGLLELAGESAEVILPFTLAIEGNTAMMEGRVVLDRRTFGIGIGQDSIGVEVPVDITLNATRVD